MFPPKLYLQLEDDAITLMAIDERAVTFFERVSLPIGICENGQVIRVDALADLLGDLLVQRGFAGCRIAAVLPPVASELRVVRWPGGHWPDDPERILALNESDLHLRVPLSYLDLHLVDLEPEPATSLLVTAPTKALESWIEVFAMAGLSLERIEAAKICAIRSLQSLLQTTPGSSDLCLLLQIEPRRSSLVLLEKGSPVYERSLPGADQQPQLQAEMAQVLAFWRQHRGGQSGQPLLMVEGSALRDTAHASELAAAVGCRAQCVDPLSQGWLLDGLPEQAPRPAGTALGLLWGLVSPEVNP